MTTQHPASDGPVPPVPPPGSTPGTAPGATPGPAAGAPSAAGAGAPAPEGPAPAGAPAPSAGFFQAIRGTGLYRSDDRWIGGVAGGLAARFGLDPLLVRGAFLVTLVLGGFGLVIYALAWALLPEQRDGRIHVEGLAAGHPDIALLGALLLFIGGVGNGAWVRWPVHVPGWIQGLFWIGAVVLVVVVIASLASNRRPAPHYTGPLPTRGRPVPPMPGMPPYGAPAPYAAPPVPAPGPAPHAPTPTGPAPATSPQGAPITMSVPPTAPLPPAQPYAGPPYQGQPYPAQPYRYSPPPVPPRPVAPPTPPKPPRRGPGATIVGVTVALALFVIAGVLIAERAGWLDRPTLATAAALIVVIFGVAIIVSGLRGRSSGILGFLAVVAMVAAVPIAFTSHNGWNGWVRWESSTNALQAGPGTTTLDSRATARDGVRISFGDATVDLTQVPLVDDETLVVPLQLGAGDFTIVVPEGARASAVVDVGAGQVSWQVGGDDATSSGLGLGNQTFGDTTDPQIELRVEVGAGNVTIEEGN